MGRKDSAVPPKLSQLRDLFLCDKGHSRTARKVDTLSVVIGSHHSDFLQTAHDKDSLRHNDASFSVLYDYSRFIRKMQ